MKFWNRVIKAFIYVILLSSIACSTSQNGKQNEQVFLAKFSTSEIAVYAISTIMNQPVQRINHREENGYYVISYIRSSDNQSFSYRVKIESNQIIWATIDGRWRDSPMDDKIIYSIDDEKLTISQEFSDGSKVIKEFTK